MRPSFAAGWHASGYADTAQPRRADPPRLQSLAGRTMGTTWSLRFDNPAMMPLDAVRRSAEAALQRVVSQMSTWEPGSDISRFNRAAAGSVFVLEPEFAEVLAAATRWAAASDGAIDPTVGALIALWGFGAHADAAMVLPPSPARIAEARARIGWQRLAFDRGARTIVQPGGIWLDLSGIAKGFAVDLVADALRSIGLSDFLVEVGGELRAMGRRPDGNRWQVLVEALPGTTQRVALEDMAIATSGDRWHLREHDGQRWSHTIDPRSGTPTRHTLASVTVLHRACIDADALATVLTVLGPDEGLAFARQHGVASLFVCRDGADHVTRASDAWATQAAHAAA